MCHDGASCEQNKDDAASDLDSSDDDSDSDSSDHEDDDQKGSFVDKRGEISRFKLRAMIYWFVVHGYNLALMNSLEFRDTKVGFLKRGWLDSVLTINAGYGNGD